MLQALSIYAQKPVEKLPTGLFLWRKYLPKENTGPRFDIAEPIYFNMVRDPVERVISWYYYVRAPWYFVERKRAFPDLPLPNPNWLRKVRFAG
jgi:hypothetical protein